MLLTHRVDRAVLRGALFSLCALLWPAPARGQGQTKTPPSARVEVSADQAAAAEALFQEARALVEKKEYAAACPKFAESQRLDPGIGTLMNLGDCYEKNGRMASAWATYREAIAEANRTDQRQREKDAAVLAARVEARLSRVTLRVPAANLRPGLKLSRDGQLVDPAQYGLSIPIDAGEHELRAEAPGHAPWSSRFGLAEGAKQELLVPALERLPEPAVAPPPGPQRTIGFVVAGAGIATVAAGGVLGLVAMSQRSEAQQLGCDDVACSTLEAKDKNDSALGLANVSTVLFIAGGVTTAAGVVLVATAPKRGPSAPPPVGGAPPPSAAASALWLGAARRGTGLSLQGRF